MKPSDTFYIDQTTEGAGTTGIIRLCLSFKSRGEARKVCNDLDIAFSKKHEVVKAVQMCNQHSKIVVEELI